MQKSSVTFSSNVPPSSQSRILNILSMQETGQAGKYLGFPGHVGRSRTAAFSHLKSSFWLHVNEWCEQPLSRTGREVLLKSILQSLPTYIMSLFCLPLTLCSELERIMNRYWWGGGKDIHKIHWMEWRKLALPKKYGGLGFRALHEFNISMLAKQGWRMLVNSNSLATQLLKAKYFPRSDFLRSELKPRSSLIWQSIWRSKELLKQGCRRLVGDGRSTLIWDDPWLPSDTQPFVQSSRPVNSELQYVNDLIDGDTGLWRQDLIMEVFNPHEAQMILSIPLSWRRLDDGWSWFFTRNGHYSVRSGYHQVFRMQRTLVDPSSSATTFRGYHLWSLHLPEKVRLLIWSAYRDILPTVQNLHQKRIALDPECPMCHTGFETVTHCFMLCPVARAVWLGSPLSLRTSELHVEAFLDFFDAMANILTVADLELFCLLCWKIWCCRNEALWEQKAVVPTHIIERAVSFQKEYKAALSSRGRGATRVQQWSETRWKPPDAGFVKINIDGAISVQQGTYGLGAVARDPLCNVIAAMMSRGQGLLSTEESEACSLRMALNRAQELRLNNIIVEIDCASIVTAIYSDSQHLNSSLGHILLDCKTLMGSFTSCHLQHVYRNGNSVAYELAKRALQIENELTWVGECPNFLAHLVTANRELHFKM